MSHPSEVPAYVLYPQQTTAETSPPKSASRTAAIVGGVAGAVVLVLLTLGLVCLSLLRARRFASRQSDTASSDPSIQVDWAKRPNSPLVGFSPGVAFEAPTSARQFSFIELAHATKQWNPTHMIGVGRFGIVYKGLLENGAIVAVKRRTSPASQDFAAEVSYLSRIRHRHLVILIGYCQENDQQIVVYDYLPNGSVNSHLYDADGQSLGKLDFKQRLSIALGAAKGLEHLHSLVPPLVHGDFKTSNVLVDENFVSKVADYGLLRLIAGAQNLASSSGAFATVFQDPELIELNNLNEKSDVYSFGVFLLELISGREAAINASETHPEWSLVEWARFLLEQRNLGALVDNSLGGNFTEEGIKCIMELCFQCVELTGDKRPTIREVVRELEDVAGRESGFTFGMEGAAAVALGSELFRRSA